jgi:hypothetical protein
MLKLVICGIITLSSVQSLKINDRMTSKSSNLAHTKTKNAMKSLKDVKSLSQSKVKNSLSQSTGYYTQSEPYGTSYLIQTTDEDSTVTNFVGCVNNYDYYLGDYDYSNSLLYPGGTYFSDQYDYIETSFSTVLFGDDYADIPVYVCPLLASAIFDEILDFVDEDFSRLVKVNF